MDAAYESLAGKSRDGLAHGHPGDPPLFGKLAFCRQRLSWGKLENDLTQPVADHDVLGNAGGGSHRDHHPAGSLQHG